LLLMQEGAPMFSAIVNTRESDGRIIAALCGELDVTGTARATAALAEAVARGCEIVIDLACLEFIDCSGLTVLVLARQRAQAAGGDLLLAAPRRQVLRILALTRLIDVFSIHAGVTEAADSAERSRLAAPMAARAAVLTAA
jgi:anti-sigma B factor antagonist